MPRTLKVSVSKTRINDSQPRYMVSWFVSGKRHRRFFKTKAAANAEATSIREQHAQAGEVWMALTSRERWRLMEAYQKATERGIDLLAVIEGAPQPNAPTSTVTLGKAIRELVHRKVRDGHSSRYISTLDGMLTQFAKGRVDLPVGRVTHLEVERFLDSKRLASRSTWRARLSTLFRFCVRRGYTSENPCDRLEMSRYRKPPPTILSLDQVKTLLGYLEENPNGLAWFVLATFAGLRPEEAQQMNWKDAIRSDGAIYVPAQISKNRRDRLVHPIGHTVKWLEYARNEGSKLPLSHIGHRRLLKSLREVLELAEWPKDVTRHTCASCWIAETHNLALVAEMLGNSESVLKRDYKKPVSKAHAAAFWALKPPTT